MRLTLPTAVLFASLLVAGELAAANRALLIGVGDYNPEIGALPGIDKDIAYARQFAGLIGFAEQDVKVLFNADATLANIKVAFNTWLTQADQNEKVFIYFSGHGAYVADTNGDEKDGQDELLVTFDTAVSNRHLVNYLLDDEVDQMVASLASKHILIVLDSCHSGSAAKSVGVVEKRAFFPGEPRKSAASRRVDSSQWVLFSASQDNETAGASRQGSFLTANLVNFAAQRKQTRQPFVLRNARVEIEKAVIRSKPDQHPGLDGNEALRDEDWFRLSTSGNQPTPAPAPMPPRQSPGSPAISGELADRLEAVYNQRVGTLKCSLPAGTQLKSGSTVQISCHLPRAGFLYVFNLGAGDSEISVLLPNRWVPSAQVEAGPITLPQAPRSFTVRVKLPEGVKAQAVRLYAMLTASELKSVPADFQAGFGALSSAGERSLKAEGPEGYEAARIEFRIVP